MEPLGVGRSIHAWVCEEHLGRAGLDDYGEQLRAIQIIAGLSCQNQCRVFLAPGLECLDDVALYCAVTKEAPRLIHDNDLERRGAMGSQNCAAGPMQDVEQERLENLRATIHALKIEALEAGKTQVVLAIVKQTSVLTISHPLVQGLSQSAIDDVAQRAKLS